MVNSALLLLAIVLVGCTAPVERPDQHAFHRCVSNYGTYIIGSDGFGDSRITASCDMGDTDDD